MNHKACTNTYHLVIYLTHYWGEQQQQQPQPQPQPQQQPQQQQQQQGWVIQRVGLCAK